MFPPHGHCCAIICEISNRKAVDTIMEARNAKCMLSLFLHAAKGLRLFLCFVALQMDSYDGPFLHPAVPNRFSQHCETCFDMTAMVVASEITARCTLHLFPRGIIF